MSFVGGETMSMNNSSSLEFDNETLRVKLHTLREENGQLVTSNHALLGDVEAARYVSV